MNPNLYLSDISNAYKLAVFLHSYLIESKISKQIPYNCPPDWFQQLEMNFQNLIYKTYNSNKVVSVREHYQYQMLQNQVRSNNILASNVNTFKNFHF